MNSKLDLRIEAVKIAVNVEGVTSENVIETAVKIEEYILGGVELPEFYDTNAQIKEITEKFANLTQVTNEEANEETTSEESVAEWASIRRAMGFQLARMDIILVFDVAYSKR